MELDDIRSSFMDMIGDDPRISPNHISLFIAILYLAVQNKSSVPLRIFSRDLKKQSKLGDRTYHTCISDLKNWGFIFYEPSFNPSKGSIIQPLLVKK